MFESVIVGFRSYVRMMWQTDSWPSRNMLHSFYFVGGMGSVHPNHCTYAFREEPLCVQLVCQ